MVAAVSKYVPGYRLKQQVLVEPYDPATDRVPPGVDADRATRKVSVFLEVEGAGHYLPKYAGNLDIMTSAALRTAEHVVERRLATA